MNLIEVKPPKEQPNDIEVWKQWLNGIEEFSVSWGTNPFKASAYYALFGHRGVRITEKATGEYIWYYDIEMGYKIMENEKTTQPNRRDLLLEASPETEFLCADGLDEAIIGYEELSGKVIYDIDKCIEILARDMEVSPDDLEDGMTEDDAKYNLAREYFEYNTLGAYVGEQTPIFIHQV